MGTYTADDKDTFCSVAIRNGFADCKPVRKMQENKDKFEPDWELHVGDEVHIPERVEGESTAPPEELSEYVRRGLPLAQVLFIRDTSTNNPPDKATLGELNVSNFVTDKAGVDESVALVSDAHRTHDADAMEDEDIFKIEVLDARTTEAKLKVHIEALRPKYEGTGTPYVVKTGDSLSKIAEEHNIDRWQDIYRHRVNADFKTARTDPNVIQPGDRLFIPKKLIDHEPFPDPQRAKRRLQLEASRVNKPDAKRFRSCYVRLVVDAVDKAERDKQTLLTTDMFDAGDSKVEILDQNVKAEYVLKECPATPADKKCRAICVVKIGRGKEVDLAIHVLRGVPNGQIETQEGGTHDNGIVKLADIRKRVETFCRQYWAQAHVRYNIVRLETVDLPSNMITVGDDKGSLSSGAKSGGGGRGKIGFRVSVKRFDGNLDTIHNVAEFEVPTGQTPEATANTIKGKIDALPDLTAEVSVNPKVVGKDNGSADVLITDEHGGRITLTNLTDAIASQDADQKTIITALTLTVHRRNAPGDYHVGGPEQRNLFKPLDTGRPIIDIHAVDAVPGTRGNTVPELKMMWPAIRPMGSMANSVIMPKSSTDSSTNDPFALPHEIGHVLSDNSMHAKDSTRLMHGDVPLTSTIVRDTKRIISRVPSADNYRTRYQKLDGTVGYKDIKYNTVTRIQSESRDLLH